jgi:hypothetical protein
MEVILMEEISLIDLIDKTRNEIKSFRHSQLTQWQYNYAWRGLCSYFEKHDTTQFSNELANQYLMENHQKYENGTTSQWKFNLIRKTITILIQCYEFGVVKWAILPSWDKLSLKSSENIFVLNNYINQLKLKGYGQGTIEQRKTI